MMTAVATGVVDNLEDGVYGEGSVRDAKGVD